jgi:hypothetical protein
VAPATATTTPKFNVPGAWAGSTQIAHTSAGDYSQTAYFRSMLYYEEAKQSIGCQPQYKAAASTYKAACQTTCPAAESTTAPTTRACEAKGVLAASDVLLGLSYIASCHFVSDAAHAAVQQGSSCSTLGDGFIYEFGTQAGLGLLYFLVIWVGIKGYHVFPPVNLEQEQFQKDAAMQNEIQNRQTVPGSVSQARFRAAEKRQREEEDRCEASPPPCPSPMPACRASN